MYQELSQRQASALALLPEFLRHPAVLQILQLALAEDLQQDANWNTLVDSPTLGDLTSQATLAPESLLSGKITAKAAGVVAGLPVAQAIFHLVDPKIKFTAAAKDGQQVQYGTVLCEVSGMGAGLLTAERTALNFLGRMSGIATLTHRFVNEITGTKAIILDTRKTAPGLRYFDKYAVRMGGAQNHRIGLFDMVMIKDNHIAGAGGIEQAVNRVRHLYGDRFSIEVEVQNLEELNIALGLNVERIMLDNMDIAAMRQAVQVTGGRVKLEASGNVSLATVRSIAETGVDYISSGSLTHSAPVLDISMRLQ